jgi:hypothetical protein
MSALRFSAVPADDALTFELTRDLTRADCILGDRSVCRGPRQVASPEQQVRTPHRTIRGSSSQRGRTLRLTLTLVVPAMLILLMPVFAAARPPQPTFGTAVVDGQYGEWNLVNDFFANMYRAGDSTKVLESKLYLRYNCATNTVYALVLAESGVIGYTDSLSTDAWIAIDQHNTKVVNQNAGNDGIPPDFAWIARGFDGDPRHVLGYEASFTLLPLEIWDATTQTSATIGHPKSGPPLEIPSLPSAVEPATFGAIKSLYR